jgi:MSHA pilin protein MshD
MIEVRKIPRSLRAAGGVTLIELVISITVVAIAVTGVVGALAATATNSANAMVRQQASAIAQSYLEEILQRSIADPDGVDGEGARNLFDDVDDYNTLPDTVVRDQNGAAVAGLGEFTVTVAVGPGSLGGLPAAAVRLVVVTVRHSSGQMVVLSGYKAQ